jgi:hypothetical protein
MEGTGSVDTLILIHQTTRCHIPEDRAIQFLRNVGTVLPAPHGVTAQDSLIGVEYGETKVSSASFLPFCQKTWVHI